MEHPDEIFVMSNIMALRKKTRKQKKGGGSRSIQPKKSQRIKTFLNSMVSNGYSRNYVKKNFSEIEDKHIDNYYSTEKQFMEDAALYVIERLSNTRPFTRGLLAAGFTKEVANDAFEAIQGLIDTSYTDLQLYQIAIQYILQKEEYVPLVIGKSFYFYPNVIGKAVGRIFNVPYKCQNIPELNKYILSNLPTLNTNTFYFFHATNWRSCKSILEEGVNHTKGRECLDFGYTPSFYLSSSLKSALKWGSAKENINKNEIAIVVFAVNYQKMNTLQIKKYEKYNREWANYVFLSRLCNRDNDNIFDDYDFVLGPILANPEQTKTKIQTPVALPDTLQLASKTDKSDAFLSTCLLGAFFFKK